MLQIIYFIKFGRDKVHTLAYPAIIDNFFTQKNVGILKSKIFEYYLLSVRLG